MQFCGAQVSEHLAFSDSAFVPNDSESITAMRRGFIDCGAGLTDPNDLGKLILFHDRSLSGTSQEVNQIPQIRPKKLAGAAGLEPVTSAVTGQRSNQLSYAPARDREPR